MSDPAIFKRAIEITQTAQSARLNEKEAEHQQMCAEEAADRAQETARDLHEMVINPKHWTYQEIVRKAADVSNFAMMVVHSCREVELYNKKFPDD